MERYLTQYFLAQGERLPPPGVYDRMLAEVERPLISICLAATRGNQIRAAQLLGLNRNTLRKKIRDLGLEVIKGVEKRIACYSLLNGAGPARDSAVSGPSPGRAAARARLTERHAASMAVNSSAMPFIRPCPGWYCGSKSQQGPRCVPRYYWSC